MTIAGWQTQFRAITRLLIYLSSLRLAVLSFTLCYITISLIRSLKYIGLCFPNRHINCRTISMNAIKIIVITIGSLLIFPNMSEAGKNECVILLHGLARTQHSMSRLESTLIKHHYIVVNDHYPSTKKPINALAKEYIPPMLDKCLKNHPRRIHFVTHSLGGIILQQYLQKNKISKLDHIVMLGPPNHGSPLADLLHNLWIFKFFLGPVIAELTTKKNNIILVHDQYNIGIIAGNYNLNPFGYIVFNEPNDGKVSISSAQMSQMTDFIVLPVTHTFMMSNAVVEKQTLHFLTYGRFIH